MGKILGVYMMPHPPIIIPEVGRGEENKIKNTSDACYKISEEIRNLEPDTIIIVTPHGPVFSDAIALSCEESIYGDLDKFGVPEVGMNFRIDLSLTEKIIQYAKEEEIFTAKITRNSAGKYGSEYELDHGTIVPLYFINKKYSNYKIVHITYGMLPNLELYKFGMCIKKAVENSNVNSVFIASGDLSHRLAEDGPYEYSPYGKKFDKEIISMLKNGDALGIFNMDHTTIEHAGECGLRSYYIMLGAMNGYNIKGELLSYEGTFGVGYGVMKFLLVRSNTDMLNELIEDKKKRYTQKTIQANPYVRLARESLTNYLIHGDYIEIPSYITDEMKSQKRGVFVSLKAEGRLRGCIGTVFPTTGSVAQEIIRNAVEAGERDPRFLPVSLNELEDIYFSVDVLTEPVKAFKEELDPKKYGVIVRSGVKSGLLLPELEGIDTVEEQLSIVLEKGGIFPKEDYTIEKFEVIRHKEQQ